MELANIKNLVMKYRKEKKLKESPGLLGRLRKIKEGLYLDNDLLFILTYMASISTAQINRDKIFEKTSEKEEYAPSTYFRKVKDLAQKWHYDYATACELIAKKIKHENLKKLFNRFSNAISAGEPDREFLEKEWKVFKTIRKDEFERSLESLKKWSDAYTALMVSTSLISIIILLSVIIYNIGDPARTLFTVAGLVFMISLFGVGFLFKSVPKDIKTHNLKIKSREQTIVYKWMPVSYLLSAIFVLSITVVPVFVKPDLFVFNDLDFKGLGLIAAGLTMFPVGWIGRKDDIKISKRDESYTVFIRSLGAIVSGAGVTIAEALTKIDQKNLGELKELCYQLYKRLSMGLDHRLSWERFIGESGSYLIHKLTSVFVDAVDLGGDADTIGEIVSSSNLELVLLRKKRDLISSGFISLVIPLHVAMVSLLMFISQILTIFSELITSLFTEYSISGDKLEEIPGGISGMNLGIFSGVPLDVLAQYTVVVVILVTIANTLATKIVKGGANYMALYYGSILFTLSGIMMIVIPPLVDMAFSFPSFVEGGA
jgi:flagellar protein FlaJ